MNTKQTATFRKDVLCCASFCSSFLSLPQKHVHWQWKRLRRLRVGSFTKCDAVWRGRAVERAKGRLVAAKIDWNWPTRGGLPSRPCRLTGQSAKSFIKYLLAELRPTPTCLAGRLRCHRRWMRLSSSVERDQYNIQLQQPQQQLARASVVVHVLGAVCYDANKL